MVDYFNYFNIIIILEKNYVKKLKFKMEKNSLVFLNKLIYCVI